MLKHLASPTRSKHGHVIGKALWAHLKTLDRCVGKVYVVICSFPAFSISFSGLTLLQYALLYPRYSHWQDDQQFSSYAAIPLFIIHLLLLVQSIQDAVAVPQPEPTFDEELVIITKSVDVATTGSNDSPRIKWKHWRPKMSQREEFWLWEEKKWGYHQHGMVPVTTNLAPSVVESVHRW